MNRRLAFAALLACPALTACGGSEADRPTRPAPRLSDAEQVAATVRRQMQAVARGDGETACGLFTPKALREAEGELGRRAGDIGCATAVEQGTSGLSTEVRAALRRPAIIRVELRNGRATVEVRLPAGLTPRDSARLLLRRTGDGWRVDGLPPL